MISNYNNPYFMTALEAPDLERPDLDMTELMQAQLAILNVRPPTISELDAMGRVSQRLMTDGESGHVDTATGLRVDTATAERYANLSDPESWLLGQKARANAVAVANMTPETTPFSELYAYTENPWSLHEYRNRALALGDVTEIELVARVIGYQNGLLALDTDLKRRLHFRNNIAAVIALEMSDPMAETSEMPVVEEAEIVEILVDATSLPVGVEPVDDAQPRDAAYTAALDAHLQAWDFTPPGGIKYWPGRSGNGSGR